jgi:hypothetical protein
MSTVKSPGALEIDDLGRRVSLKISHPPKEGQRRIDHRLAFLACASARFDLVETGEMTLDEAVDGNFVERFRAVADITCRCEREMLERWERDDAHRPPLQRTHRRDFGDSAATSVVDAVLFELSRYGLPRLNNEKTQGRLAELSVDQLRDVRTRLARMKPRYPEITAELIDVLRDQIK